MEIEIDGSLVLLVLLSSAPRGFAARSRILVRLVSLAQIGELARRLILPKLKYIHLIAITLS